MTDCIPQLVLGFQRSLPIHVEFDAPEISSDGGALLLRQVDERLGVTRRFAALVPDERLAGRVRHSREEQVRQRVYQIALGYEDGNDATRLRHDPLLKTACGRPPAAPRGLSSQPTLSRLETSVPARALRHLVHQFEADYVAGLPADTEVVVLDIDSTDDPTHGGQQLTFFNAFYDEHMYHPVFVFDGVTGQLVTGALRPGNSHAARGASRMLERVIRAIHQRLPGCRVVVRADAGFGMPWVMDRLEALDAELGGGVDYILGLQQNPVLKRLLAPQMNAAAQRFVMSRHPVQLFADFEYQARTWPHARHVVAKAEHNAEGANPRFVVTTLRGFTARDLYIGYRQRGQAENRIKDLKNALRADRLSCHAFVANYFRLLLHMLAYRLMHALRQDVAPHSPELARAQFDTLRLRLLKVAALVGQSVRRVLVRLPRAFPFAALFRQLLHQGAT